MLGMLKEGEIPAKRMLKLVDGRLTWIEEKVIQDPNYKDPEIYETDKYRQVEKEEYYDYITQCKACRTDFIAYDKEGKRTMNFCPCCGIRLKREKKETTYGEYLEVKDMPEDLRERAKLVNACVSEIKEQIIANKVDADWNTMKVIVKEPEESGVHHYIKNKIWTVGLKVKVYEE